MKQTVLKNATVPPDGYAAVLSQTLVVETVHLHYNQFINNYKYYLYYYFIL